MKASLKAKPIGLLADQTGKQQFREAYIMIRLIFIILFLILYFIFSIPMFLIETIIGWINKEAKVKSSQWVVCKLGFKPILFLSGVKLTVKGKENIPKGIPVLYVANHRSYFDIIIGYTLAKNNTGFIAKKEMEKLPFVSLWMKFLNCQFLDRDDIKAGLKMVLHCIDLVKSGTSIWIFPEGTRTPGDEMLPFKEGSFKIAEKSGCPIIPVSINNTESIFENHIPWVKGSHVIFEFGTPLDVKSMSRDDKKHLGQHVQSIIKEMVEKNRGAV